jgi:hypothetical protein
MTQPATSPRPAPLATDRLAELVRAKHDVLLPLCELARQQASAIEAQDTDRLLSLLAAKQPLLGQLERLERALDPFRSENPDQRTWRSPGERRACQQVAEKANALLAEILQLEQTCGGQLKAQRDQTARQLQQAGHLLAARSAYGAHGDRPARTLDLSSED